MSYRSSASGIALATVFLAGCAGRSGSMLPAASPALAPPQVVSPQAVSPAHHRRLVRATFTVKWKHPRQKKHVGAHYLPVTARSASIAVNGGVPQYLNAPATTIGVYAPPGVDTFSVAIYDEQNGLGNVLAEAEATKTIVVGGKNSIAVTTNGVVASLALTLSNPRPPAGKAATVKVSVAAMDPDGNVIVSPGDYSTPVQLSIVDPSHSGTLALSAKILQNPSAAANLVYNGGSLWSADVTASAAGASSSSETFTPTVTVREVSASPTSGSSPQWITTGLDGGIWYTEAGTNNKIAKLKGTLTEYTIPTSASDPQGIISASDGRLWFAESATSKIAAVTTSGTFTEMGTLFGSDGPLLLVDRGDGNVWYAGNAGDHVGYFNFTGSGGELTSPTAASAPFGIAAAPDLNLYFTESAVDKIGRFDNLFGTVTEIALTAGSIPEQIVLGPDGNLWFTENSRSRIGVLTPSCFCIAAEYPTLEPNEFPVGITVGRDGALWFTENGSSRIGRITTSGVVSEYDVPTSSAGLKGITAYPSGAIFATESSVNKLAVLDY